MYIRRVTPQLRLPDGVALGVGHRQSPVVAAQSQQILLAPSPAHDLLGVLADHGYLPRRLWVVDHEVALGRADGEQRGGFGPYEKGVRVVEPGVDGCGLEGPRVPDEEQRCFVIDDSEEVSVLVPAET